jgi:hypothetical protein
LNHITSSHIITKLIDELDLVGLVMPAFHIDFEGTFCNYNLVPYTNIQARSRMLRLVTEEIEGLSEAIVTSPAFNLESALRGPMHNRYLFMSSGGGGGGGGGGGSGGGRRRGYLYSMTL